VPNEAEFRRWNDEHWAAAWPRRERLTDEVSPFLLDAVGPSVGRRVGDIGCGGGNLTLALAKLVEPGGEAIGIDISAPLLELARTRAREAGVVNAQFVQMDMQTGSLGGEPLDLAVSQFGVMFFDEPTAAFASIRRHLVPGGRLVFACWQEVERNPWYVRGALRSLLSPPPTPPRGKSPTGPFVLGDDEYVRDLLGAAGFVSVESEAYETTVRGPAGAVIDRSQFRFMGIPPDEEETALALVERHLERFAVGPGEYEYPLAFRVYQSVNP
jgi:SAM-dependent methyltransferase